VKVGEQAALLTGSEQEWLRVRGHLMRHRFALGVAAAGGYPAGARVAGTPLLADRRWLPAVPLDLAAVDLHFDPERASPRLRDGERASESVRPTRSDGTRFPTYSAALARLAAPGVFRDLPTYRLLHADLAGARGRLVFGRGTYFDGVDIGEAAAHEYAAREYSENTRLSLRTAVGDPCNLANRPANLAVSMLTLRVDGSAGSASFPLHWRDPARVGHAGGLYQVVPVGVFQPSGAARWNERNDFDLWRSAIREFSEELLGNPENYGSEHAPIDYDGWPLAARLNRARDEGRARVLVLGMGTDPLTFATDLLTVAAFDAPTFDEIFGDLVGENDEGRVMSALEFSSETVERLVHDEPMQAAGAALLALAWEHRGALLV
jgi:hypothetical protein